MNTFIRRAFTIAAASLALAPGLHAQSSAASGSRWQGWLGCWTAAPAGTTLADAAIVCITPTTDADVVEFSAIASGRILSRDRIDASGRTVMINANGCDGTARSVWSADQRRVFLRSAVTCEMAPSEILALLVIAPSGEWLDVRKTTAGSGANVRVARYRDVGLPSMVPNEIADALVGQNMAIQHARRAAGAPVASAAIVEASRVTDSVIVAAWVYESGQSFEVNAHALRSLADAGVPANVRDAMAEVSGAASAASWRYGRYGRGENAGWPRYDPWAYGYYRPFKYDGFAAYLYGYATYTVNFLTFGYGYPGFGYGFPSVVSVKPSVVGYVYPPVIVLHQNPRGADDAASNGMVGKGETADPQRPGATAPSGSVVGSAVAAAAAGVAAAVSAADASKNVPISGKAPAKP